MTNNKQKESEKKTSGNKGKNTEKKSETMKQIENLEKALANVQNEDAPILASGDTKNEALAGSEKQEVVQKDVDFDEEVKKIFSDTEPSEEIKEEVKNFEDSQHEFEKELNENPENAAEIVQEEIKKMEALKGKVETLRKNFNKTTDRNVKNDSFTNWWNGTSGLY